MFPPILKVNNPDILTSSETLPLELPLIFGFGSLRLSPVQNPMRLTDQLGAVCRSPPSSEAKAFQLVEGGRPFAPPRTRVRIHPVFAILTYING